MSFFWLCEEAKGVYHCGGGRVGDKVQGIRSINGRYRIDRGRLRIVWEMEKVKNLYV